MSGLEDKEVINPQVTGDGDNTTTESKDATSNGKPDEMSKDPSNGTEQSSMSPQQSPRPVGLILQQCWERLNRSPRRDACQPITSPRQDVSEKATSRVKAVNQLADAPLQNANQGSTVSCDSTSNIQTGANQNQDSILPNSSMETPEANTAIQSTSALTPSGMKPLSSQLPTAHGSPYPANDPHGYYAKAKARAAYRERMGEAPWSYCRSLIDSIPRELRSEAMRLDGLFRQKYPKAESVQIVEAVMRTLAQPQYTKSGQLIGPSGIPLRTYVSGSGSGPFTPINGRPNSPEFDQTPDGAHTESQFSAPGGMPGNGNNDVTPLEKPVVEGRIVQRHRKRSRADEHDENEYVDVKRPKSGLKCFEIQDFEEAQDLSRAPTNFASHRAEICQDQAVPTNMHEERGMNEMFRFRVPGAASTNTLDNGYVNDRSGRHISDDDYAEESEAELFVSDKPRCSKSGLQKSYDSHHELSGQPGHSGKRKASRSSSDQKGYFNVFGQKLEPSRYSGAAMPWDVSADPKMVNQSEVSDASLLKRGIARGSGKTICKRGYGASDPENIAIVNMKEFNDLSFDEITTILNDKRIESGKVPSLSAVGVNSRYNRTAPLLFAAQGKKFVPLSKRKGRSQGVSDTDSGKILDWTDEFDMALVNSVKEVDAARWNTVALLFEEKTGKKLTPSAAAVRHNLL